MQWIVWLSGCRSDPRHTWRTATSDKHFSRSNECIVCSKTIKGKFWFVIISVGNLIMSKWIKKHIKLLKFLKKAKPDERKVLLQTAENSLIFCLCECIKNVLNGNVNLSKAKHCELSKHAGVLQNLADQKNSSQY